MSVYPHVTPATKENPFEIRFINRTNMMVYMDVSVWYMEMTKSRYREIVEFVRSLTDFFRKTRQ
ncbi:MAG: hypothetical protein QXT64_00860 [Desulfurococcaceae archaeon]